MDTGLDRRKLLKKSIKVNAVVNIIRVTSNLIFPILIFPYVSRVLGPDSLGKINFTTSTLNFFVLIASMGIPSYAVIVCSKHRQDEQRLKRTICELLYINLLLTVISYLLLGISILGIPKFQEYRGLLILNSMSIFFTVIGVEWLYTALEEFNYIMIRSIIFKIVSIIMIFTLVHGREDYYVYAIILIVSSVGANVLNFLHAHKYIKFYPLYELDFKQHIKPILLFFSASIAATINGNTDTVMLGFIKGDMSVGLYDFSIKIKNLLTSFITAALSVTTPRFALYVEQKKFSNYRKLLRKVVLVTLVVAIAFSIFFICFSEETILILGGAKYLKARSTMIVLTICVVILGMTWTLGVGVLQPLGREREYAKTMFIACGVNVVLNSILIPTLDSLGASIATLVTESINMILFYYYAQDFLKKSLKNIGIEKMIFSAISAGIVAEIICNMYNFNGIITICIGFIIFSFLYGIMIFMIHKEIRKIVIDIINSILQKIIEKGEFKK